MFWGRKKMKMVSRRGFAVVLCVICCLGIAGCGATDSNENTAFQLQQRVSKAEYSLRVATAINSNTPAGQTLIAIRDELEKRTDGRVTLDIFWESTLGGATEIAEQLRLGTVDIGFLSSAVISNYTPSIDVLSLPFIISDRDQIRRIIDQDFEDVTRGMDEKLGRPLGIWEIGYRHLCTREDEVKTLEDCEGLTIRILDGQVYKKTFEALGCIPSNIATSEVVPALQQGTIDGVEEPMAMIVNQQQYSFCNYITMIGYNYSIGCPIMSEETISRLPGEVADLVFDVFEEYKYRSIELGEIYENECIEKCIDEGMTVNYPEEDELQRFRDAVAYIWEEYESILGKDLIDQIANE